MALLHSLCNSVDKIGGGVSGYFIDKFMELRGEVCSKNECEMRGRYISEDKVIETNHLRYAR